jgi:hypothetical protein
LYYADTPFRLRKKIKRNATKQASKKNNSIQTPDEYVRDRKRTRREVRKGEYDPERIRHGQKDNPEKEKGA